LSGRSLTHLISFDETEVSLQRNLGVKLFDYDIWQQARRDVYETVVTLISSPNTCVVILDDNMYYRSMRYQYYQLARKRNCGFVQIMVKASLDIALARNSSRPNPVDKNIIQRMQYRFEEPDPVRCSWEKNSLFHDNSAKLMQGFDWDKFYSIGSEALPPVVDVTSLEAVKDANREKNRNSAAHQLDLATRKTVSQIIANVSTATAPERKGDISKFASCVAQLRQRFLKEYMGQANLDDCTLEQFVEQGCSTFRDMCSELSMKMTLFV